MSADCDNAARSNSERNTVRISHAINAFERFVHAVRQAEMAFASDEACFAIAVITFYCREPLRLTLSA